MKTIWKFPVEVTDEFELKIPEGAEILTVQMQGTKSYLWALVDSKAKKETRTFRIFGTGNPIDLANPGKYVGTFQQTLPANNSFMLPSLVWHLFEAVSNCTFCGWVAPYHADWCKK